MATVPLRTSAAVPRAPARVSHNGPIELQHYDVPPPPDRRNIYVGMHQVDDNSFHQPVCFTLKGFVSGAELAARSLYAAYHTVSADLRAVSFRCTFFAPVVAGSLDFHVQRTFTSKASAERDVHFTQARQLRGNLTTSTRPAKQILGAVGGAPSELQDTDPEALKPNEQLFEEFVRGGGDPTWPNGLTFRGRGAFIDVRPVEQLDYLVGPQNPTFRHCSWSRVPHENPDGPVYLHELHLMVLTGVQMLYVTHLTYPGQRFQLMVGNDIAGWFHDHDFDTSDFVLLEMECNLHYGLHALVTARVWSRAGRLIATLMQECTLVPEPTQKSRL